MINIKPINIIMWYGYIIIALLTYYNPNLGGGLLLFVIVFNIYLIRKHLNNQIILILLIYCLTYWAYMLFYYFGNYYYYTGYIALQTIENTNATLMITSLFMITLFSNIKQFTKSSIVGKLVFNNNKLIYYGSISIMLVILIYAINGNNIFTGKYGLETTNSTMFEYYFIFAISAYCFSNTKIKKNFILIVNIIYIVSLLLLGLRLVALQVIMMIFIFNFENKFKTKWIILFTVIGFLSMSALSIVRLGNGFNIGQILGILDGALMTNQGDVFFTSTAQHYLIKQGILDIPTRIKSLLGFVANIFLLPNHQLEIGIINRYIKPFYNVGGGGFGAMYAYIWGGYLGVFALAKYISYFINKAFMNKNGSIYGTFLMFTFFRWYSYSLVIIFKMALYLILIFQAYKVIFIYKRKIELNIR